MEKEELVKNTLDSIPTPKSGAKHITSLVKQGGRVTGYRLSDGRVLEKAEAVNLAKQGGIAGVGVAHRGDTEYLKSIPNSRESDNLGNLPSISG